MLAGAARDLQHETARRQPVAQDFRDRLAVPQRGGCRSPDARGLSLVEAALVDHQCPPRAPSSRRLARRYISMRCTVNMPSAKAISGSVSMAGLTLPVCPRTLRA